METLLPAVKFLIYVAGIYLLTGVTVMVGIVAVILVFGGSRR